MLHKRVKRDLIKPLLKTLGDNWKPQWTDPGWKKMWYLVSVMSVLVLFRSVVGIYYVVRQGLIS